MFSGFKKMASQILRTDGITEVEEQPIVVVKPKKPVSFEDGIGVDAKMVIPPVETLKKIQDELLANKVPTGLSPDLVEVLKKTPVENWFNDGRASLLPLPGLNLGLFGRSIFTHTTDCWTKGEWVFNTTGTRSYPWMETLPWESDEFHNGDTARGERILKWQWVVPESCPFNFQVYLREGEFCSMLNGRGVLLVGDSLNNQFFRTMFYFLKRLKPGEPRMKTDFRQQVIDTDGPGLQLCDCWKPSMPFEKYPTISLKVSWNYKISFPGLQDGQTAEQKWDIGSRLHEIVILSRGAHFTKDELFQPQLNATLHQFRNHTRDLAPNQLMIFRTASRGHAMCSNHHEPWRTEAGTGHLWNQVQEMNPDWHWREFFEQARFIEPILYEPDIRGVYMDIRRMTGLRPDGRAGNQDCLHYLAPGPLDHWGFYLFNMLRMERTLKVWEKELWTVYGPTGQKIFDASIVSPPWPMKGFGMLNQTLSRTDAPPFPEN